MSEIFFCNICNDSIHYKWLDGSLNENTSIKKSINCQKCNSRPRTKTFRYVYDKYIKELIKSNNQDNAMVISGVKFTREYIKRDFSSLTSSSLYGNYGENTIKSDLRNLKEFNSNLFNYVDATLVLDYILEHVEVFESVYRVLKKNGIFLFHIAEARLLNDNTPTYINNYKKEIIFKSQYPEEFKMPSVRVGRKYLVKKLCEVGMCNIKDIKVKDIFSDTTCSWFLSVKE